MYDVVYNFSVVVWLREKIVLLHNLCSVIIHRIHPNLQTPYVVVGG